MDGRTLDAPLVYTVEEAAKQLKISRATMYVLLDKGELVGFHPGGSRRRLIARSELERYASSQTRIAWSRLHRDPAIPHPDLLPLKRA